MTPGIPHPQSEPDLVALLAASFGDRCSPDAIERLARAVLAAQRDRAALSSTARRSPTPPSNRAPLADFA